MYKVKRGNFGVTETLVIHYVVFPHSNHHFMIYQWRFQKSLITEERKDLLKKMYRKKLKAEFTVSMNSDTLMQTKIGVERPSRPAA